MLAILQVQSHSHDTVTKKIPQSHYMYLPLTLVIVIIRLVKMQAAIKINFKSGQTDGTIISIVWFEYRMM